MQTNSFDKERSEEVRRKRILAGSAGVVIVLTVISCIVLSRLAVPNVDTKEGISKIRELENTEITPIEKEIANRKEAEGI